MHPIALIFLVSFLTCFIATRLLIRKLQNSGILGRDVNKPNHVEVPEMGGLAIVFGMTSGILIAVSLFTFFNFFPNLNLSLLLAGFSTILLMAIVGIVDDLLNLRHLIKASLPLFASFPLVAIKAGTTTMKIPLIGAIDFGIIYTLILIPIGITGASNVTNMLAGFNGLEASLGFLAALTLALIGLKLKATESVILLVSLAGSLLAFLYYNWYPSRIFMGNVGTLMIGATIAASVIIGNYEAAGVIIIIPYAFDFFIKAANGFPTDGWWGKYRDGKLYCEGKPISLCQLVMKIFNGISERNLVLVLIAMELLFCLVALFLYF